MHRVFKRADGGVAVMVFATDDPKLIERDTANYLNDNAGSVFVGQDLPLPATRRFRNVWTADSTSAFVDMPKARGQVLDEIRVKRDAALAASDVELLRAQEKGEDTRELATRRQALRDLPTKVADDLAKLNTPEELEAYSVEI